MLSDETFPIDLDDDQFCQITNTNTLAATETFETSASTSAYSSESTCNTSSAKSFASSSHNDSHYASFDVSNRRLSSLAPPGAPIKKKKSNSCHDLMASKKNYDHVESKVRIKVWWTLRGLKLSQNKLKWATLYIFRLKR